MFQPQIDERRAPERRKPSVLNKSAPHLTTMARWSSFLQRRLHELVALALSVLGSYLWIALEEYDPDDPGWTHTSKAEQIHNMAGATGAWFADVSLTAFGYMAYLFPILCLLLAARIFFTRHRPQPMGVFNFVGRLVGLVLVMLAGTALAETHCAPNGHLPISTGGALGRSLGQFLTAIGLNTQSSTLIFLAFFILGVTLLLSLSWFGFMELLGKVVLDFLELIQGAFSRLLGLDRRQTSPVRESSSAIDSLPVDQDPHHWDDLHLDEHFLLDPEPPIHSASPATAPKEPSLTDRPSSPQRKEKEALSAHSEEEEAFLAALDRDDPFDERAVSIQAAALPPERRQSATPAATPRFVPPPLVVPEHLDEDGQFKDWKEEPVIRSVSPWVRPTAQRAQDPVAPAATPKPSASSSHFSARDDDDYEVFDDDLEDDSQPTLTMRREPALHTTPKPELAASESLAALASRIITADRQGHLGTTPTAPTVPDQPSRRLAEEPSDSIWLDVDDEDEIAEPEPIRLIRPHTPPKVPVPQPMDDDREDDFLELDNGRREPSVHLERPVTLEKHSESFLSAPQPETPAAPTPVSAPPSAPLWMSGSLPPISLLDAPEEARNVCSAESLEITSRLLERRLKEFGVEVKVEEVYPGPVITRFEIQPAPGIKSSRISNLAKDLARSLAVTSVRVVEVIPGRTTVGIEIPNEHRQIVRLSEVLSSEAYHEASSPVTLALGHDISGQPMVADLARMPHLLVAGTTGSGKSVGVNAMILSILLKSTPDEARLIMIDPKMLELSIYEGIPHLLCPVVTDMKEAANALRWSVAEMDRRYKLMAAMGVRNLAGFNRKIKEAEEAGQPLTDPLFRRDALHDAPPLLHPLPTIVVIVDEFADMMMIVGKKVEDLIARIAQKARAAGIHLILATQRPSVDVITGLIKANIPTRIAFQVSSKIDSRTILDMGGAEQLLGHGDMLYMPPGTAHAVRVHGAFVSDDEVHRVVEAWKQRGQPDYIDDILKGVDESGSGFEGSSSGEGGEGSEEDPLYDEAVRFVTESRRASISAVQRKLKIGYNRAARMIEAMEEAGVVTSMSSNGSREVIAPPPVRN